MAFMTSVSGDGPCGRVLICCGIGKRRYNIKLWKTFTDCFNCLPIAAVIDEKIFTMHGGLSPDLQSMEQIRRVMRPTDVPDTGLLCDLLWSDPDKEINGWSENDRGVSFVFGPDVVTRFLQKHDMDLICRAHQVVEDGYEFFAKRQLVTLFSAPNYCGEFDNAGAMMSVDETLMCSFQVRRLRRLVWHHRLTFLDPQACGKEAKVCLRWHEHWPTRYSSARQKEERDGQGHLVHTTDRSNAAVAVLTAAAATIKP